jgi:hypothetical protein
MGELPAGVTVRCLARAGEPPWAEAAFLFDGALPEDLTSVSGVVLPRGPAARAQELLARGIAKVYLGQAALDDATAVGRLTDKFGGDRVGVYAPARRMEVTWAIDTVSNADFRFMTPSLCEPCWEILNHAGERTGAHVAWWIGRMFELGASSALVRADIADDADLNICASLAERFGERLWIGPLFATECDVVKWTAEAGVRQLVVPAEIYAGLQCTA